MNKILKLISVFLILSGCASSAPQRKPSSEIVPGTPISCTGDSLDVLKLEALIEGPLQLSGVNLIQDPASAQPFVHVQNINVTGKPLAKFTPAIASRLYRVESVQGKAILGPVIHFPLTPSDLGFVLVLPSGFATGPLAFNGTILIYDPHDMDGGATLEPLQCMRLGH